jgi:pimeloyl-ACP methyl ester carboxylesterase
MASFLLIHGSAHGAWCWDDLIPALVARGHAARAIDLPSHGADPTPPDTVTLAGYAEAIAAAMRPGDVVVAHSMAGIPVAAAADLVPGRAGRLIYLCSYLPVAGHSVVDMRAAGPRQPLLPALRKSADGLTITVDPDMAGDVFYHDCAPDRAAWAIANLCPQPVVPQATPYTPGAGYEAAPRGYIVCEDDRAIPPEYQAQMAAALPPADVRRMATSHSPFLSAPAALADILTDMAKG